LEENPDGQKNTKGKGRKRRWSDKDYHWIWCLYRDKDPLENQNMKAPKGTPW